VPFEIVPVSVWGVKREDTVVEPVIQPSLEEVHDWFGVQVIVGFGCQFFEQRNVLIHVVVLNGDMFDLCFGILFSLRVEESLSEFVEKVLPRYQIIMLAVDPCRSGQFPPFNLLSLDEGQGKADFVAVVQDVCAMSIKVDIHL
jgi:hypothetical protein